MSNRLVQRTGSSIFHDQGTDQGTGPSPARCSRPRLSILDRAFQYTGSSQTDLKKTFARIIRERKALAESERKEAEARLTKAIDINKRRGAGHG